MPDFVTKDWPENLTDIDVHMVGAKGTGMCALAELLVNAGARVSGSDVTEVFYTDAILAELGVIVFPFGDAAAATAARDAALVVRSAAYDASHPVVAAALGAGRPVFTYPEALGALSRRFDASAVAGVHGKTTTTALAGSVLRALDSPSTVVVGSAVSGFGDRSTWTGGDEFLVAETCEYRRHFLHFVPRRIVLTSIESDHQDYYPTLESIRAAFDEFIISLPEGGELIYCADDPGAADAAAAVPEVRPDIITIPYGAEADGPWKVEFGDAAEGRNRFRVAAFDVDFELQVPGRHIVLDAAAALALAWSLESRRANPGGDAPSSPAESTGVSAFAAAAAAALASFRGSRRRSEIVGEAGGILFMDDYAHHPTAVAATLRGLKDFHPRRRLVVDFQAHTYSRTAALFEEFSSCFGDADVLLLQPIYASAREQYDGSVTGKTFRDAVAARRPGRTTLYCASLEDAAEELSGLLRPGDLFLTLGAGNNRPLGQGLLARFKETTT